MNDFFRFKQFTVKQDQAAMKVGTDGVLLGAWASLLQAGTILDIGTGTGLIALMAAQRNAGAFIDAVEINDPAFRQAQENTKASPWAERIQVYHTSIFTFVPGKRYDHILCNPPFFTGSTPAPESNRNTARHCCNFSHVALLKTVDRILEAEGKFSLILPPDEARNCIAEAEKKRLFLSRLTDVIPMPGKSTKRMLLEFSRQIQTPDKKELILEITHHHYTEAYINLTRDFYLKM